MRNLAKKLTCGLLLSLLNGSLSACGVTSEMTTTHPSSPFLVEPGTSAVANEGTGPGRRVVRPVPASAGRVARVRPTAASAAPVSAATLPIATVRPRANPGVVPAEPATAVRTRNMRTQSGRIIDEAGQPLVGATVLLKGTTYGASTDANGDYSLAVPLGVNTFVFGYSGYTEEVAQSLDGQPLTVTLLPAEGRAPASNQEKASTPRLRKKSR